MADKADITPEVLKWARASARISVEDAAAKAMVTAEKIEQWEDGNDQPTIRQAELLAKAYKRPLAVFFLPSPPRDFQTLQDFRRPSARPLGTASIFIIREMQQKQSWLKEIYEEGDEENLPFVGRFSTSDDPARVAQDMLQTLDIDPTHYTDTTPIKEWMTKAEAKGIFISRSSLIHSRMKLNSDELQGFAIADPLAPFVFINSEDWDAPQLFTLVHELAHIWIAESGISSEIDHTEQRTKDKFHPVELFCNAVAGAALMPATYMNTLPRAAFSSAEETAKAAQRLGVSSFALLVRSLHMQLIGPEKYRTLKSEADRAFRAFEQRAEALAAQRKERKTPGGPDYYLLLVNKNGHHFTKVVMDAFRGGFIQPTEASSLLSAPVTKFPKLEAHLYK